MPLLLSATPVTSTAKSIMLKRIIIYTFAERGGKDSYKYKDKDEYSTKDAEKEAWNTFDDRADI